MSKRAAKQTTTESPVVSYISTMRHFDVNPRARLHGEDWDSMNMSDVLNPIVNPPKGFKPILMCATKQSLNEVLQLNEPSGMLEDINAQRKQADPRGGFADADLFVVTAYEIHHNNVTRFESGEHELVIQAHTSTYLLHTDHGVDALNKDFLQQDIEANVARQPDSAGVPRERFPLEPVYADTILIRDAAYEVINEKEMDHKDKTFAVAFIAIDGSQRARLPGTADILLSTSTTSNVSPAVRMYQASAIALALTTM